MAKNDSKQMREFKWPMQWVLYDKQKPTEAGYYYILYLHKDNEFLYKAIWYHPKPWKLYSFPMNGPRTCKEYPAGFYYKDYVKDVVAYLPKRFDYYCPCVDWATTGKE